MNQPSPKISVVMACRNEASMLRRAIDSILEQTFAEFEFIIIDDNSDDETPSVLKEYAEKDTRIVRLRNESRQGLATSLNRGIDLSKAEIIARMDADDISLPDRFSSQMDFLEAHPEIDILGTGVELFHKETGEPLGPKMFPESHQAIFDNRYQSGIVAHPTVFVRKRVFRDLGTYDPELMRAQDTDLWLRLIDQATFHNLPEIHLRYAVKPQIRFEIVRYNLKVKFRNMRRRRELMRNFPVLIRDILVFTARLCGIRSRTLKGRRKNPDHAPQPNHSQASDPAE